MIVVFISLLHSLSLHRLAKVSIDVEKYIFTPAFVSERLIANSASGASTIKAPYIQHNVIQNNCRVNALNRRKNFNFITFERRGMKNCFSGLRFGYVHPLLIGFALALKLEGIRKRDE